MRLRPPGSTLFPYTTLFRSADGGEAEARHRRVRRLIGQLVDAPRLERRARARHGVAGERPGVGRHDRGLRSEEHTSELQSQSTLACRLLREKKNEIRHLRPD